MGRLAQTRITEMLDRVTFYRAARETQRSARERRRHSRPRRLLVPFQADADVDRWKRSSPAFH